MGVATLLSSVTVTGAAAGIGPSETPAKTFQAILTGVGAISATVNVEVSSDGVNFLVMGTITLSGTTIVTDGFASSAQWLYMRGNVTAIAGTSAALTLLTGI
jgi:hypothetical protein